MVNETRSIGRKAETLVQAAQVSATGMLTSFLDDLPILNEEIQKFYPYLESENIDEALAYAAKRQD